LRTAPRAEPSPAVERCWTLDALEVLRLVASDPEEGLSSREAQRRLETCGPNELEERPRRPAWAVFLGQFASTMIVVLLVAAGVTAALGDVQDTVAILAVVLLNGIVGFVQEYRAEGAMAALQRMTSPHAQVLRDGDPREIPAIELVPGDVVLLSAGDVVGADLRLFDVAALRINEAPLTGESEPVAKSADPLPDLDDSLVADRRGMAFSGTPVTYGRGRGVVVATGMATELGRIASLLQKHGAGRTPLQRRLASLGRLMAIVAIALCGVVFMAGVAIGEPVEQMFLTAVSLAVSAIPEGLPIMVTVALALGARRMAARRALVRTLPTVETLGSVDVICTDKTGTLTENRMLDERVWTPAGSYRVDGEGYAPDGTIAPEGAASILEDDPYLVRLLRVAAACNDARLHAPTLRGEAWALTGDPTEGSLLALAGKIDVFREALEREAPRVDEIAFDASRRMMTTVQAVGDDRWVTSKGAPEAIAPLVRAADRSHAERALEAAASLAGAGYRVLAFAEKTLPRRDLDLDRAEEGLEFLGIVGMADPPRPSVAASIDRCGEAGIRPVMVTGDAPRTASSIAERLGMLDGGEILTGAELAALDDAAFEDRVEAIHVYARTDPEQKLRIVDAWKDRNRIVAMTGDGVNDAPALRRADIGVAMGITGTEVSKEAADMVLADDDFSTIVLAVEEGRRIYDNIRRFLRYMLATNSGELWLWFFALSLGLPIPLLPLQILWVNLLTDGLPSIALGVEPAEPDTMHRPPRPVDQPIWGAGLWQQTVWLGLLMGGVCVWMLAWARDAGMPWQTMVFTTISFLQLGHALTVRSDRVSAFRLGVRSNPWVIAAVLVAVAAQFLVVYLPFLQRVFETEPLSLTELAVVMAASTAAFVAVEIDKLLGRLRGS
jgi:Ca2+-transporting ATPase